MKLLKKILKGIFLVGLASLSIYFASNFINRKTNELKRPEQTKQEAPKNQTVKVQTAGVQADINLANIVLDIGYAFEGQKSDIFISELKEANKSLMKYKIYLDVKEKVEVDLPHSFITKDFIFGIKDSFFKPHDYYFVLTSSDYNCGDNDFAINALTENSVCLIDNDFPRKNLEKVIEQEILRFFINAKNTTAQPNDKSYFNNIDERILLVNLWLEEKSLKQSCKADCNLEDNLRKHQTITVNVALDGVTQEYAKEIFSSASQIYNQEFNISFQPIGFYDYKLPKPWNTKEEMKKIKHIAKQKSDIYILLTSQDWSEEKNDNSFSSVAGEALSYCGFSWVETCYKDGYATNVLVHEISHLFGAEHIYHVDSVMSPSSTKNSIWLPKTREAILKNKFRKWNE